MAPEERKQIAVIGSGIAGLVAARGVSAELVRMDFGAHAGRFGQ